MLANMPSANMATNIPASEGVANASSAAPLHPSR